MPPDIFYSAENADLNFPCLRGSFFPAGMPKSEAALCAEMARLSYCRQESGFAFDQEKIRSVLGPIGFTNCQFFESKGSEKGRGTHCFLALGKAVDGSSDLAVLAFRGTDIGDFTNLSADADLVPMTWEKGGKVHRGFAEALREVRPSLDLALQALRCRALFTGHSLGAALATLMASVQHPACLYTFGSPRVGDANFVSTLKDVEIRRYVDCCDLVTRVPPEFIGYTHAGDLYYIDRDRKIARQPGESTISDDQDQARVNYLLDYALKIGNVRLRDLADHSPINYVAPLGVEEGMA
jgi:triacylglycerol lipase